jgi:hypothetical protein
LDAPRARALPPRARYRGSAARIIMDPEVAERARGVFDALAVRGRPFEDIQASDFADWRMFFRFVKDASADPTTALGELNATSFLGKHDISVAAWGKSVKERSPLFKEEFDKFMRIERVREALAADLGVETPPRVEAKDENVAARPSVSNEHLSHPAVPAVPSSTPPRRVASSPRGAAASNGDGDAAFGDGADETRFRNADRAGGEAVVETTLQETPHVITPEFHRERVLAYLDGFKTLLVDLRQKVDEIATANVLTVGGAVERADARLETALARVDAMVQEETNAFRR